ncbi:DUF1573 domain-containing protein [Caloramator sp. E03]|uniref:DUF1573 domain-containing protein n=1 Tax=Caloramator sp. E03 TaxID=2576307 RepID=UPI0011105963|nr:DUF1573 domain-containing protein [Caloramator sp. E03]QCX33481.1 DUF1573 domain-containing protein [Caloramator sp. E03]
MKRVKAIYIFLSIIFLLLGVGYSLFYKTIDISNQISVGLLSTEFVEDGNYPMIMKIADYPQSGGGELFEERSTNLINGSIINKGEVLEVSLYNLFPGGKANCIFKIKNTGTIPVTIDNVSVNIDPLTPSYLLDAIKVNLEYNKSDENGRIYFKKSIENSFSLRYLQNNLNQLLKWEQLKPRECIIFGLPPNNQDNLSGYKNGIKLFIPSKENNAMNSYVKFTIKINVKQSSKI